VDAQTGEYLERAAQLVGLEIDEAHRPGGERFLALAAEMAAVLERLELDDAELALAPVFRPPEPGGG
jgi:hypothetical protein